MIIPDLSELTQKEAYTLFWFRRDLRLEDNHGLYQALHKSGSVVPIFIFDKNILDRLEDPTDRRIQFIYMQIQLLKAALEAVESSLLVCYGEPTAVYQQLNQELRIKAVYANRDYEPYASKRDLALADYLAAHQIAFHSFKDQVIFDNDEVSKDDGTPYTVFTPYMKQWKAQFRPEMATSFDSTGLLKNCLRTKPFPLLSLPDIGFQAQQHPFPSKEVDLDCIKKYDQNRDLPSVLGTSRLSIHFRFGTISIRSATRIARSYNEVWLNELIWRNFYMTILEHFPYVVDRPFKRIYEKIAWENNPSQFQAWCRGQTGYPIVDAGMRELNATGYMHNRLRMITASFLTKHLLIDWRWGEAYFAKKLLDFDLAANNGGWQWVAGVGCDAAPYFRVFNPYLQTKKFDPALQYVKKWVPECEDSSYPRPIIEHQVALKRTLVAYKDALSSEKWYQEQARKK